MHLQSYFAFITLKGPITRDYFPLGWEHAQRIATKGRGGKGREGKGREGKGPPGSGPQRAEPEPLAVPRRAEATAGPLTLTSIRATALRWSGSVGTPGYFQWRGRGRPATAPCRPA